MLTVSVTVDMTTGKANLTRATVHFSTRLILFLYHCQQDYFTRGQRQPPEDSQQDWKLTDSREDNGVTTLQFYRKLNTSDANDTVIQVISDTFQWFNPGVISQVG